MAPFADSLRKIKREQEDRFDLSINMHVSWRELLQSSTRAGSHASGFCRPPLMKLCNFRLRRWFRGNLFNNRGQDRQRNMHLYVLVRRIRYRTDSNMNSRLTLCVNRRRRSAVVDIIIREMTMSALFARPPEYV